LIVHLCNTAITGDTVVHVMHRSTEICNRCEGQEVQKGCNVLTGPVSSCNNNGDKKKVDVSNLYVHPVWCVVFKWHNCFILILQFWLWCGYKAYQFHDSYHSWDQSTQALSTLPLMLPISRNYINKVWLERYVHLVQVVSTKHPVSVICLINHNRWNL